MLRQACVIVMFLLSCSTCRADDSFMENYCNMRAHAVSISLKHVRDGVPIGDVMNRLDECNDLADTMDEEATSFMKEEIANWKKLFLLALEHNYSPNDAYAKIYNSCMSSK